MRSLVLKPFPNEVRGDDIVRRCLVSRPDGSNGLEEELWFQFPNNLACPLADDCDSYVIAMLMNAMRERRNIIVHGSVSKKLLSNLVEFQAVWHKWEPVELQLVEVQADTLRQGETPIPGAVCAFSGGLDATFMVWRNSQNKNSYRSQKINFCTMLHGFDIPLENTQAFDNSLKIAGETLADLGLKVIPIRTNFKELQYKNWKYTHGTTLVAVLNNFKLLAGTGMIASSEGYSRAMTPWGSNPLTDHLMSSDGFEIINDGASHDRVEKAKAISEWKVGVDNLRVCWELEYLGRNCGKCEKCLRTQFEFLACNLPIPKCFPANTDLKQALRHIRLKNDLTRGEWLEIIEHGRKNKMEPELINAAYALIQRRPLVKVLLRQNIVDILFPKGSQLRETIKKLSLKLRRRKKG